MKAFFRILIVGTGVIVLLLVAAAALFAYTFDPNDHRDRITALVRSETGRDFTIEGDLKLTFFPWLGFEMGTATLSNAPGFGAEPFATTRNTSARVRLMPLFRRQLEVGLLRVEGLTLNLEQRADGSTNWDDLAALANEDDPQRKQAEGGSFDQQSIGGIELRDASVVYADRAAMAVYRIGKWDLETGRVQPGEPFDVKTEMDVALDDGSLAGRIGVEGTASVNLEQSTFGLSQPKITAALTGSSLPVTQMDLAISGSALTYGGDRAELQDSVFEIDGGGGADYEKLTGALRAARSTLTGSDLFDFTSPSFELSAEGPAAAGGRTDLSGTAETLTGSLDKQSVKVGNINAETYGLTVRGNAQGEKIFDAPRYEGRLIVAEFAPRPLMRKLGMDDLFTADPKALSRATLDARYVLTETSLSLREMQASLDESKIAGSLAITDLDSGAMSFDLDIDQLNADRYLEPTAEGGAAASAQSSDSDVLIPVETLRPLDMNGALRIGELQMAGIKSSQVKAQIAAKNGRIRVHPASANLYGGTYSGNIGIDVSGAQPRLSMDEKLAGVRFGDLSRDLYNVEKLSGLVEGAVKLDATGATMGALRSSLAGTARFAFADGAFEGTDLWYEIRKAKALFEKAGAPEKPAQARTPFSDMSGSAKFAEGIMASDDFAAVLPFMRVTGAGKVNLVDRGVDYQLKVRFLDAPELAAGADSFVGEVIPVRIAGTLSEPRISPDYKAYLAQKATEKVDEVKDKLRDKLLDRLGLPGSKKPAADGAAAAAATGEAGKAAGGVEVPAAAAGADGASEAAAGTAEPQPEPEKKETPEEELKRKAKEKLKGLFGGG